ncbi:glycosyltransferase family 39 protein [Ferruginibacter sp. SUN106]|uniref:glycosyltransferase family 39 protein n=1 Tax=Ferruginibacter sp. SUN106 TaxID=2978348 RepID=UPI003D35FF75
MSSILVIILLTFLQLATGFGLLTLFRIILKPAFFLPLAILMGIAVFSVVPFLLQLLYIPITPLNVLALLLAVALIVNVKFISGVKMAGTMFRSARFSITFYEIPFLLAIGFIIFVSAWRCFYYPPTPNDVTTGAEAIAEFTVREKTMLNSVFLLTQNGNTLKPPFITCLQIIYKFAGFPFGQVWLINVFICFIVILYHIISASLHRVIAGVLVIFFLAIPEMYAYTFMLLYDYSNAVFFFLSVFFMLSYFKKQQLNELAFAGLLMGIAVYIRPETLLLCGAMLPAIFLNNATHKAGIKKILLNTFVFVVPTLVFYLTAVYIYINHYLPTKYSIAAQINPQLTSLVSVWDRFVQTNDNLLFSEQGIIHYSYFIFIFLALFAAELIVKRKFNGTAKNYLYVIAVVFVFFPLLSHVLPGVSIDNTVKRAFFKLFPLMLLYISNNELLVQFSNYISRWERGEQNEMQ